MVTFLLIIIFAIVIAVWFKDYNGMDAITNIVNHIPKPENHNIVGNLKRQFDNDQAFVIDPVDQKKIWLNSNDDMYEDADDKVWKLYS